MRTYIVRRRVFGFHSVRQTRDRCPKHRPNTVRLDAGTKNTRAIIVSVVQNYRISVPVINSDYVFNTPVLQFQFTDYKCRVCF